MTQLFEKSQHIYPGLNSLPQICSPNSRFKEDELRLLYLSMLRRLLETLLEEATENVAPKTAPPPVPGRSRPTLSNQASKDRHKLIHQILLPVASLRELVMIQQIKSKVRYLLQKKEDNINKNASAVTPVSRKEAHARSQQTSRPARYVRLVSLQLSCRAACCSMMQATKSFTVLRTRARTLVLTTDALGSES